MMDLRGFGEIHFPLTNRGYLPIQENDKVINANIKMLLNTSIGERVNLPEYGSNLDQFLFYQKSDFLYQEVREEVIRCLQLWEKRIVVNDILVTPLTDEEDQAILITIKYSLKTDLSTSFTFTEQISS